MSNKHYCVYSYKEVSYKNMCPKPCFCPTNLEASCINIHCCNEVNRLGCFCDPLVNLTVGYLPTSKFSRNYIPY